MNDMLSIMAQAECKALLIEVGYRIVEPTSEDEVGGIFGEEGMPILETEVGFSSSKRDPKKKFKVPMFNYVDLLEQYRSKMKDLETVKSLGEILGSGEKPEGEVMGWYGSPMQKHLDDPNQIKKGLEAFKKTVKKMAEHEMIYGQSGCEIDKETGESRPLSQEEIEKLRKND